MCVKNLDCSRKEVDINLDINRDINYNTKRREVMEIWDESRKIWDDMKY